MEIKIYSKKESEILFSEEGLIGEEMLSLHKILIESCACDYIKKNCGKNIKL